MPEPLTESEPQDFSSLSIDDLRNLQAYLQAEQKRLSAENRLADYRPYSKQAEFHAAGALFRERMLMAANQVGKTWSAAFETAMHLTGRYAPWWTGKRFDRPVRWIAGSESSELTKKGVQRLLIGAPENEAAWGTGAVPKALLASTARRQGVPDALAGFTVKHVSGGI